MILPLTVAQREIWLAHKLTEDTSTLNVGCYFEIAGSLDIPLFQQAVESAIAEADALHIRFMESDEGGPRQVFESGQTHPLGFVDLHDSPDSEGDAQQWMKKDLSSPVDLEIGPLFRQALLGLTGERYFWYLRVHHLIMDGYGVFLLGQRVTEIYSAIASGSEPKPTTFGSLSDFITEDIEYRNSADYRHDRKYWLDECSNQPDIVTPSLSNARADGQALRVSGEISASTFDRLSELATAEGVRWPALIATALGLYLSKTMATSDVSMGLTVTGRTGREMRSTPIHTSNVVPLRLELSSWTTLAELARSSAEKMLNALGAQRYRGEDILRDLGVRGTDGQFGWHLNIIPFDYALPIGNHHAMLRTLSLGAVNDLGVYVYSNAGGSGLRVEFEANPARYGAAEVAAHHRRFLQVLTQLAEAESGDIALSQIQVTDAAERAQVLESEWNSSFLSARPETVLDLIEEQVARTPHAPAVLAGATELTYEQLNTEANRYARVLVASGVRVDDVVGIAVPRSVDMIVAILAILKAGAAYLPIDLDYPPARIAHIVDDSGVTCIVTSEAGQWGLPADTGARLLTVDSPETVRQARAMDDRDLGTADRSGPLSASNLAYVIYTSGSTGRPKGVAVQHSSTLNYVSRAVGAYPSLSGGVLLYSSISFDITLTALFGALAAGGHLIVSSVEEFAESDRQRDGYAFLKATPTHLALLDTLPDLCSPDDEFIVAGEPIVGEVLNTWRKSHEDVTIINHYGPSECTCGCVDYRMPAQQEIPSGPVPIGRPFGDAQLYVLDFGLRPVPVGVVGELYIGGGCQARGYLGRPELTSERFVANPFGESGARMYRTGDLVKWTPAGYVEFVGRSDHQVKLRGYRVEMGEVQAAIAGHPAVAESYVLLSDSPTGERLLAAYVVPAPNGDIDLSDLRSYVARLLPSFMVPASFSVLSALPKTPNGKVDRAALPATRQTPLGSGRPPVTAHERAIATFMSELLGTSDLAATDDFFERGGNSLLAIKLMTRIRAAYHTALSVKDVFEQPTAEQLAALVENSTGNTPRPRTLERPEAIPLSLPQRRLWFLNQSDVPPSVYNIPLVVDIRGALDTAALGEAIADVLDRHEVLRTIFPETATGARQVILERPDVWHGLPVTDIADDALEETLKELSRRPFDIVKDIPLRSHLFRVTDQHHVLLVIIHHIAGDGWSFAPFGRDLELAYAARKAGNPPAWSPLPLQYADYAVWQTLSLEGHGEFAAEMARQTAYWADQLASLPEELRLPTDRPRRALASYEGDTIPVAITAPLHAQLRTLASRNGATLYMVLHAALVTLFTRLGAGNDIPLGTGVAGRTNDDWDDLVGFFINTLVLRVDASSDPSFTELLGRVRATDLEAFAHQDVPFDRIVETINPSRSLARHPLFQTLLLLRNTPRSDLGLNLGGIEADGEEIPIGFAKFDLVFSLRESDTEQPAGIEGFVEYSTDIYDRSTVLHLVQRFVAVLQAAVDDPDRRLSQFDIVAADERSTVLSTWGKNEVDVTRRTIPQIFEAQVHSRPDAPALVGTSGSLTYAELNCRVNRLARALIRRGIGPEDLVAIALPRSIDLVIATLAVVKSGAAYIPVDIDYPAQRIDAMFADAHPRAVVAQRGWYRREDGEISVVELDSPEIAEELTSTPDMNIADHERTATLHLQSTACAIFTSGSTGRPKGTALTHAGISSFLTSLPEIFHLRTDSRVLQFGSPSFDAYLLELCMSLLSGACLVVEPTEKLLLGDPLCTTIQEHGVTHLTIPPSALAVLPENGLPTELTLTAAGETVPVSLVRDWAPGRRMLNIYGPAECTVIATWAGPLEGESAPPIGKPRVNTWVLVLDATFQPVPVGVAGDVYLSGDGLGRGYIGRPGLTSERFVAHPYGTPGERMYRTGDLARWRADGSLEFAGRSDHQVKIRGFRVELGEVEATVAAHPDVAQAAVVIHSDAEEMDRLVSYVVPTGDTRPSTAALREFTARTLPSYMVPAVVISLDALPMNPNGKLDRAALPEPDFGAIAVQVAGTGMLALVGELWCEVLGVPEVEPTDNFFVLGGHSLLASKVVNRLSSRLDVELSVAIIFQSPTVETLAQALEDLSATPPEAS
ncbi:amino acid adenylation domain-containing protein [Streptomyces sp. NPDC020965]|uniref:amino acid adenylation domain-containing protein n=1 Tax=Streptomyces sp. NPDC020965 TaxID=3365105 RepID=UPI0037B6E9D0